MTSPLVTTSATTSPVLILLSSTPFSRLQTTTCLSWPERNTLLPTLIVSYIYKIYDVILISLSGVKHVASNLPVNCSHAAKFRLQCDCEPLKDILSSTFTWLWKVVNFSKTFIILVHKHLRAHLWESRSDILKTRRTARLPNIHPPPAWPAERACKPTG